MQDGATIADLVQKSAAGWTPTTQDRVGRLVQRWGHQLDANTETLEVKHNVLVFVTRFQDLRLKGMDEVRCLLIGGNDPAETQRVVDERAQRPALPGHVMIVLALSDVAYAKAQNGLRRRRALFLSAEQLIQVLDADSPRKALIAQLDKRFGTRRLTPYNYTLPTPANMFFGRANEVSRLKEEDDVCFAIAGPSRVGKTSLVTNYRRSMILDPDERSDHLYYIDCYECPSADPDVVARFLAMRIQASSRSDRVTSADLIGFLKYQRAQTGIGPELILDEVDQVCNSAAFRQLGEATKLGYCRLILCGRGQLLRMALAQDSPLGCRLELLRLKPLSEPSAEKLLFEPLRDLGFSLEDQSALLRDLYRLTGRLPHLMQFYAKQLIELAIQEDTKVITRNHVGTLKWDHISAGFFLKPLTELAAEERLVALYLLKHNRYSLQPAAIMGILRNEGFAFSLDRIIEICDDLVINNILTWDNGVFNIANDLLPQYARAMGYLDEGLSEAKNRVMALKRR
jgi:hypothetical protein